MTGSATVPQVGAHILLIIFIKNIAQPGENLANFAP